MGEDRNLPVGFPLSFGYMVDHLLLDYQCRDCTAKGKMGMVMETKEGGNNKLERNA